MARAWFLTSNNPHVHYPGWCRLAGDGTDAEEDYRAACEAFIEEWRRGRNNKMRAEESSGAATVFERGESGTLHLHALLCSKSDISMGSLKSKFPKTDFSPARGSVDQVLDYIYKRGKHEGKAGTQLCEPVVWGSCEFGNAVRGTVYEQIDAFLEEGMTPMEIYALGSKYSFYGNAVERRYNALRRREARERTGVRCVWHLGEPGSGKTHYMRELEARGKTVAYISDYERSPFDDYDGEDVMFLDELRNGCLPTSTLLSLMETYRTTLPARYSNRVAVYSELHIASIKPPEDVLGYGEPLGQLRRRLDEVMYHIKVVEPDGRARYLSTSVTGLEYQSLGELERVARERLPGLLEAAPSSPPER